MHTRQGRQKRRTKISSVGSSSRPLQSTQEKLVLLKTGPVSVTSWFAMWQRSGIVAVQGGAALRPRKWCFRHSGTRRLNSDLPEFSNMDGPSRQQPTWMARARNDERWYDAEAHVSRA